MTLAAVFSRVLTMSLTGSAAILAVCLARLALRRAPAWLPCALWAVVLVRLLCPVGLPLLPEPVAMADPLTAWADDYLGETTIYQDNTPEYRQAVEAGRVPVEEGGGRYVVTAPDGVSEPATVGSRVFPVLGGVWLAGLAGMLFVGAAHWRQLRRRLTGCVRLRENIWLADRIPGPFVMGVIRPRIYLPSWLEEPARGLVLRHERQHIRQRDHWTRLLAWAALCLHWFNPLVWLAFSLSGRDMEIRCHENATRGLSPALRADYAAALLRFAAQRRPVSPSPAFSEGDAGARIRHLARWKRPAAWAVGIAALCCGILAVGLLADPAATPPESAAPSLPSPPPEPSPAAPQSTPAPSPDDAAAPASYVSGMTLPELLTDCGFAADATPYAVWPETGEPELTLWFDPDRGVGCGTLYADGASSLFRFDQTGPCWYANAIDCWPADPFDPACTLAPDPESTVRDYQETTDRDEAGRIVRWTATGFLEEAGETVTVRSDTYTYREDGTLACRDYFHSDRLFGTWLFHCRLWYDGQQRLTRASGTVTHGRTDYFYLYQGGNRPAWQLCLDESGGFLAAWMTPME